MGDVMGAVQEDEEMQNKVRTTMMTMTTDPRR